MTTWQFGPYFAMPNRDVRIGTEEREQAVQLLSQHLSAGRLELAEFEERVSAVYAARTAAQLAALFRDLPGPLPPLSYRPVRRVPRRAILLVLLIVALVVLVADIAFPPFFLIPVCWLVLHARRRRYAYGYRRH